MMTGSASNHEASEIHPWTSAPTGSVVIYSDLRCPWAHIAVHKLHAERIERGIEDVVLLEHRCFPLEMIDPKPTPIDDHIEAMNVCAGLAPEAGWNEWATDKSLWPTTSLIGFQAVQAMRLQGPEAMESLDLALRRALFSDSRCISLLPEVLDIAKSCGDVDVSRLEAELWSGRPMEHIHEQLVMAQSDQVVASPHVFTSDGRDWINPGIDLDTSGDKLAVNSWDQSVYGQICEHAMSLRHFD